LHIQKQKQGVIVQKITISTL